MRQNIKKIIPTLFSIILILAFVAPCVLMAQGTPPSGGRFTPCGGTVCSFQHLGQVLGELMKFLIEISIPIATIAFVWAGFLYITALDDTGKVTQAKNIFKNVAIGLGLMLGAWVIVNTVLVALFKTDAYIPFLG